MGVKLEFLSSALSAAFAGGARSSSPRQHVTLDLGLELGLGGRPQVERRLQDEPEFCRRAEVARQPKVVSAVIPRRSLTTLLIRVAGTRWACASAWALRPSGPGNSSRSTSPGWMGRMAFLGMTEPQR
jgi:hypothetical protein